jgi:hypothetical protein
MTVTTNKDFVIYNDQAQTGYFERIQDNINVFNKESLGAITFISEFILGDFSKRAFFNIGGSIQYRDVDSEEDVKAEKISQGEKIGVKCPYMFGPFESTKEAFLRTGHSPEVFSFMVGLRAADAFMEGCIQYALKAVIAATKSNSNLVVKGNLKSDGAHAINKALSTFGDKADRIALLVMNSAEYRELVGHALTEKVYGEVGAVIYGAMPGTLGKPVLVTDQAPKGLVFGLQAGAVTITESQPPEFASYPVYNKVNLGLAYRGEGVFNIDVLGYSWTGKENPKLEDIANQNNWKLIAKSNKATAGFIIEHDEAITPSSTNSLDSVVTALASAMSQQSQSSSSAEDVARLKEELSKAQTVAEKATKDLEALNKELEKLKNKNKK